MPTRTLRRVWCKTCNDFELHDGSKPNLKCLSCDTNYTKIFLKDIPIDKLEAQQKRWKSKQTNVLDAFIQMTARNPLQELMDDMSNPPGYNDEIIESDAGMISIEAEKRLEREKRCNEARKKREEDKIELDKYRDIGRNDKCICGSNLKYKKCCLPRINSIRI